MERNSKIYEPPTAKVYRFADTEQVLTASSQPKRGDYAANALNELMGVPTTTIEKP